MKILHISTAKSWRGGEQQLAYLVHGLEALHQDSIVLCPEDSALASNIPQKYTVLTYTKRGGLDILAARQLIKIIKQHQITLIHGHDAHAHNMIWMAHLFFGLDTPVVMARKVDFKIKKSSSLKYNCSAIKAYICVSEAVKKILQSTVKNHSILHVVHDGVDLTKFDHLPPSQYLRSQYGILSDQILIANIAAIAGHKDYYTFVNTAEILIQIYGAKLKFLCIGADGGEQNNIEAYIKQKGLQECIKITGFIPDIYKYISEIDVFLFTSKLEALGSTLLDVMASKVPIVSTRAGGIPEILEHRVTALLAEVGDASSLALHVQSILQQAKLRDQLSSQAFAQVHQFSENELAKKTLKIYQQVGK